MTAVEIFGFAPSTYTRTARMICREKGVAYDLKPLEFRQPSHRALHPFLRMPALRHGETVLFETLAIGAYVDAAFPGPALQPADACGGARMLGWVSAEVDYLYPRLVHPLLEESGPGDAALAAARETLEPFDAALGAAPFLAGEALSLADLFLAPMIAFAEANPKGASLLDGLAGLAAWRGRVQGRASFAETQP